MATCTIHVQESSFKVLQDLSSSCGESIDTVLEKALDGYRRRRFLELANAEFAGLKEDPAAWAEEFEERKLWESTLADGL